MRKVRVIEDVVSSTFTVQFKDKWWRGWETYGHKGYNNESSESHRQRDYVLKLVMHDVKALEKEKVIYETPKKIYYG